MTLWRGTSLYDGFSVDVEIIPRYAAPLPAPERVVRHVGRIALEHVVDPVSFPAVTRPDVAAGRRVRIFQAPRGFRIIRGNVHGVVWHLYRAKSSTRVAAHLGERKIPARAPVRVDVAAAAHRGRGMVGVDIDAVGHSSRPRLDRFRAG